MSRRIFRLRQEGGDDPRGGRFAELWPLNEDDVEWLDQLGEDLEGDWEPMSVSLERPSLPLPDFFFTVRQLPVFNEKVIAAVGFKRLESAGEVFALDCPDGLDFKVFRAHVRPDVLDLERSRIDWFPRRAFIRTIHLHVFHEHVSDSPIFRVPGLEAVYVSQDFVDGIDSARVTGFRFEPVWQAD